MRGLWSGVSTMTGGLDTQYQRWLQLKRECGFGRGVVGRGKNVVIARTDSAKTVDAHGGHVRGACNGDGHCAGISRTLPAEE